MKIISVWIAALALLLASGTQAATKKKEEAKSDPLSAGTFAGLALRGIGPAVTSGRVVDLAVDPKAPDTWYVASAGGGVWKTTTHGISWTPVFDSTGSYSVGCVTVDPNDSTVVWVGSGENNSQRSVSYGDGIYKSVDGGKTWTNMGLKSSEHIGKIVVDPRNSDVVYVAAQGPLWSSGGDRGLYKTTDGGKTWKSIIPVDENTGVTDIAMDPRN
ncbi:MAG TPA: glycosyl hydrolase, partial [Thermoanaerobaculia bacterium]